MNTVLLALLLSLPVLAAQAESVSLVFAGDVVLDGQPAAQIRAGHDPFAAFATLFAQADIRVANLECVVATIGEPEAKLFKFRAAPETLKPLQKHIDAVSIANNHSGDFGRPAFSQMLGLLDQAGIGHFGGGNNLLEAHRPLIIERHGLRIALLGYNEFMPRSFEADADGAGSAWSEDEQVVADIHAARSRDHADIVIPIMHWGWENESHANGRQQQLAHLMIDAGADVVIGGHPHVVQDVAYYHGKLIVYSVGNFMIDLLDNEEQTRGWVLQLALDKQGVRSWHTTVVKINDEGIPALVPNALSPCGSRDSAQIKQCQQQEPH